MALAPQLPRSLQGLAPALAIGQIDQFGIRAGQATEMVQSSFEAEYAAAADQRAALDRAARRSTPFAMLKDADPSRYAPANGAEYPRSAYGEALKQIAQLVKADVGLEVAFAESGNWDHHVNEGAAVGQLGEPARRLRPRHRGARARSRRSHGRTS